MNLTNNSMKSQVYNYKNIEFVQEPHNFSFGISYQYYNGHEKEKNILYISIAFWDIAISF